MRDESPALTPELLLRAYVAGLFPMAEGRDNPEIFWVNPRRRGIIPLDGFHISRSLARTMRRGTLHATVNEDFAGVVEGCADRQETWINAEIAALYLALHQRGHAHSIEIRDENGLVGGLYGVSIGGAFFGESMFSRVRDASKIAMAVTVDLLREGGFALFDTQFITDHLASMGGIEISRAAYRARLDEAVELNASLAARPVDLTHVLQRSIQTS
ncbi:MAG: leucyl/phenylalanyl-tRNA--protein transferase [Rhodobacterales bacterium]|nr:MAG: leucyl/phenylalanyl-tRNA--protein transferase [Rhodobacterales bacterium]